MVLSLLVAPNLFSHLNNIFHDKYKLRFNKTRFNHCVNQRFPSCLYQCYYDDIGELILSTMDLIIIFPVLQHIKQNLMLVHNYKRKLIVNDINHVLVNTHTVLQFVQGPVLLRSAPTDD